jgi:hypothetical protein
MPDTNIESIAEQWQRDYPGYYGPMPLEEVMAKVREKQELERAQKLVGNAFGQLIASRSAANRFDADVAGNIECLDMRPGVVLALAGFIRANSAE